MTKITDAEFANPPTDIQSGDIQTEVLPSARCRSGDDDPASRDAGRRRAGRKNGARTYSFMPQAWHKKTFLKWLRRTHAWCGFWGALTALLFGVSGIVLNHRGGDLKLDIARAEVHKAQFIVAPEQFATPDDLSVWLVDHFAIEGGKPRSRITKGRRAIFSGQEINLPAQWDLRYSGPNKSIRAQYVVGSNNLEVSAQDNNILGFLNRLHLGNDLSVGWVLFADSIAGALIMLCLTGMLLWTKLHGTRIAAMLLFSGAIITGVIVTLPSLMAYSL
ncbi:PepSY-associated TM helix domain-containing protein [Paremcibacter congregatus]|uniref:PepSY-associated TM helix domain-containing protein n=1 Tax=Paremcibacter congregatus TaxID=2043170 RepID=UPI0030EB7C44